MKKQKGGTKKTKRRTVTRDYIDSPDIISKRVVTRKRKGTTITEKEDMLSDLEFSGPGDMNPKKIKREPIKYGDKKVTRRRYKSKTDKSGTEIKRKEKIVYDDDNQMKKRKQRKIRFGKNKGKIRSKTVHYNKGKRTVTKRILDKTDVSKLQTGGFHLEPGIESIDKIKYQNGGKKDRGSSYHPDVIKSKRKRKDRGSKFHPGYVREPAPPYDYSKESLWNPDGTPKYKKIEGQGDAGPDNVWNTSDDPPGGTNPDWRKAEKAAKDAGKTSFTFKGKTYKVRKKKVLVMKRDKDGKVYTEIELMKKGGCKKCGGMYQEGGFLLPPTEEI